MRLKELSTEQLREINIAGLSQRQISELTAELLMRLVFVKKRFKAKANK